MGIQQYILFLTVFLNGDSVLNSISQCGLFLKWVLVGLMLKYNVRIFFKKG